MNDRRGAASYAPVRFAPFAIAVLFVSALASTALAEPIESASRSTLGYVTSEGRVENASRSTLGYVTSEGRVENASRSTLGYILPDVLLVTTVVGAVLGGVAYGTGVFDSDSGSEETAPQDPPSQSFIFGGN